MSRLAPEVHGFLTDAWRVSVEYRNNHPESPRHITTYAKRFDIPFGPLVWNPSIPLLFGGPPDFGHDPTAVPVSRDPLIPSHVHVDSDDEVEPYLIVGMALRDQNIHHVQLVNEAVALELLSDTRANDRDGEGNRVHGLHLRRLLYATCSLAGHPRSPCSHSSHCIVDIECVHCRKLRSPVIPYSFARNVPTGAMPDKGRTLSAWRRPSSPLQWSSVLLVQLGNWGHLHCLVVMAYLVGVIGILGQFATRRPLKVIAVRQVRPSFA